MTESAPSEWAEEIDALLVRVNEQRERNGGS